MKDHFLRTGPDGLKDLAMSVEQAVNLLAVDWLDPVRSYSPSRSIGTFRIPQRGEPLRQILEDVGATVVKGSVRLTHPLCMAHMQSQPTLASVVAELIIGATNQSMDSWDESPSATDVEQAVTRMFCDLVGYGPTSGAVFDAGGTLSNLMAVIIARDRAAWDGDQRDCKLDGLPPADHRMRIVCSEEAHFTIEKAAAICGLGARAVVKVPVGEELVLDPTSLREALQREVDIGNRPIMVVATAGTTNAGNIPDLSSIGRLAREFGCWYHIDAAYGGALLLSDRHAPLLAGLDDADSITLDPHKMLYISISCGIFLLADSRNFDSVRFHAEYLNPEDQAESFRPNLVDRSLQTTRRFDALKLYMSLRHLGREGYQRVIDGGIALAKVFASRLSQLPDFELAVDPQTTIVLFRYCQGNQVGLDELNARVQQLLYEEGKLAVSKTRIRGSIFLKANCMNPLLEVRHLETVLEEIRARARRIQEVGH